MENNDENICENYYDEYDDDEFNEIKWKNQKMIFLMNNSILFKIQKIKSKISII